MKSIKILALLAASLANCLVTAAPAEKRVTLSLPQQSSTRDATSQEIKDWTYYSHLAASAYCKTVIPMGTWQCTYCTDLNDLKIIKAFQTAQRDTNVLVARGDNEKTIYVLFRGSQSYQNFVADDTYTLVNYGNGTSGSRVHLGFLQSYNDVKDQLVSVVLDQVKKYPSYNVSVTGHSLGGATALLCALDLYERDAGITAKNLLLHTLGQPRVGNAAFANYVAGLGLNYKRAIHQLDSVPHVPPIYAGYLHAGEEYWIKSDATNTVKVCESALESSSCSDTMEASATNIMDHLSYFGLQYGVC